MARTISPPTRKAEIIFPIIISFVALIVAIWSCSLSEKAFRLSRQDLIASRSAIYMGNLGPNDDELFLAPIDPNMQIQFAIIHFPPQLAIRELGIFPPNFGFKLHEIRACLEKDLKDSITQEKDPIEIRERIRIPFIIESNYLIKGIMWADLSLYELLYIINDHDDDDLTTTVGGLTEPPSTISIRGLLFIKRLPSGIDPQRHLSTLWKKRSGKIENH